MACNENVVKNMANEVTRNCQAQNVTVDPEFVTYIIDLLLLNPKYGKLFATTINRNNLAYFVDECVNMVTREYFGIKITIVALSICYDFTAIPLRRFRLNVS